MARDDGRRARRTLQPDNCPTTPHGDDIGDDTRGRRYLYCAECGREFCTSPDAPELRQRPETYSPERVLVPYRLPDGTIVQVDDSAAKGNLVIDYTLAGGRIVSAYRVLSPGEAQRAHLDTFRAPGLTPAQAAGFTRAETAQAPELITRILAVRLAELTRDHGIVPVLEAFADLATQWARAGERGNSTGPYAALAVQLEAAREYAVKNDL